MFYDFERPEEKSVKTWKAPQPPQTEKKPESPEPKKIEVTSVKSSASEISVKSVERSVSKSSTVTVSKTVSRQESAGPFRSPTKAVVAKVSRPDSNTSDDGAPVRKISTTSVTLQIGGAPKLPSAVIFEVKPDSTSGK